MLYVARCGQNFFHLEECLSKFKKKMQVYISKYEALETQKRGTTMITEEVQNKVKEAIKKLHWRLREPLARHDKCNWRPKRYVVYYGSYVSFLVQTELNRMEKFRFPLTKPEDIDIALDRCADEMCFESGLGWSYFILNLRNYLLRAIHTIAKYLHCLHVHFNPK